MVTLNDEALGYAADIPEKGEHRRMLVNFTSDVRDVESFYCKE